MEEPGKTPKSPTRAWQAVPLDSLITLGSGRNSPLHTLPRQPWFLPRPLGLTSGEHLLPCWWPPAARGSHWETPWQWHRWRVVSLEEKSQVSFAIKQLQKTHPFVKLQAATGWKYWQSFCCKPWVEGGDQLCVRRAFLELFFLQKSLSSVKLLMCLCRPNNKGKLLFRAETEMQPCGSRGGKVCPALLDHKVIPYIIHLFIVKKDPESYYLSSQHLPSTSTLFNLFPSFFTLVCNSKLGGMKTGLPPCLQSSHSFLLQPLLSVPPLFPP